MLSRVFWSVVVVCVFLPGESRADDTGPLGIFHHYGYSPGPRVAPPWGYPLLNGGPFITYPTPPVYPGVFGYGLIAHKGHGDTSRPNGVSLCGPPVPVYGPIPAIVSHDPLVKQWRNTLSPRLVVYGWFGPYSALPRHIPLSVSVWPTAGSVSSAPVGPLPAKVGGCLTLSVKVPHPTAEVRVDGRPTTQTGTDRTFESPPLETGQSYAYTVTARWMEGGQVVEMTKAVTGAPGEVVRVDFATPVVAPGK